MLTSSAAVPADAADDVSLPRDPITDAQVTANLEYVRNRIREEVVTAAYGTDVGGQLGILNDVVAQRAVEAMSQASEMAENARHR